MKILVNVSVEKIKVGEHSYTFRDELLEVEVLKVYRTRANRKETAWYYQVEHKPLPNQLHISGDKLETENQRANINRKINKQFKPKDFIFVGNQCILEVE